MSNHRPRIQPTTNGPYLAEGFDRIRNLRDDSTHELSGKVALCRCGGSRNKPFCDGTHAKVAFSSAKAPDRVPDKRETYEGREITIYDNRGVCAHSAKCTDGLKSVFRLNMEPWINADGASVGEVVQAVQNCPSGALSYSSKGEEHRDHGGEPSVAYVPNGPYVVRGGADLVNAEMGEGATMDHFTLCRCGASQNKPFCSGAHWDKQFDPPSSPQ